MQYQIGGALRGARAAHDIAITALLLTSAVVLPAARLSAQRPPAKRPAAEVRLAGDTAKKFKAIWEPVNYSEDAELSNVAFVSADEGWVTGLKRTGEGEGGFILHTKDGGDHWNLQLGDPHSATRAFSQLFLLDATHGWVSQYGGQMLRTTDGENWESAGAFFTYGEFTFRSPQVGFNIDHGKLFRTEDAGTTWKPIYECAAKVVVDGLTRDSACEFRALSFPTAAVGYATTNDLPDKSFATIKTSDGGATWRMMPNSPAHTPLQGGLGYADSTTLFTTTYSMGLVGSFDGGQTWRGVPATQPGGRARTRFADPEVGWIVEGTTFTYTSNGGKRWNSAQLHLPGGVNAFSLPRRDRGYVVGDHGMIYRYRVVPIGYTSKGMMAAPAM